MFLGGQLQNQNLEEMATCMNCRALLISISKNLEGKYENGLQRCMEITLEWDELFRVHLLVILHWRSSFIDLGIINIVCLMFYGNLD